MVDVHKVYEALCLLKDINPLYSQIVLPTPATALHIEQRITEVGTTITEGTAAVNHEELVPENELAQVREPMIRRIERRIETSEEQRLYQNYTIQPLHAPRANEKASTLYQFLRVDEPSLDSRCKQLDTMCFPDLFPRGFGGLHQAREKLVIVLLSRILRF